LEEGADDSDLQQAQLERATTAGSVTSAESKRKSRGVINPGFKFPPSPTSPGPVPVQASTVTQSDVQRKGSPPAVIEDQSSLTGEQKQDDEASRRPAVVTPSNIEVPAPPLVEKERSAIRASLDDPADDDVGDTVDIPLN
jgi:hypothetical protein